MLALSVDAVRLVFVDGLFRAELSDSVQESGFEIVINDERQSLERARFSLRSSCNLTKSLSQSTPISLALSVTSARRNRCC